MLFKVILSQWFLIRKKKLWILFLYLMCPQIIVSIVNPFLFRNGVQVLCTLLQKWLRCTKVPEEDPLFQISQWTNRTRSLVEEYLETGLYPNVLQSCLQLAFRKRLHSKCKQWSQGTSVEAQESRIERRRHSYHFPSLSVEQAGDPFVSTIGSCYVDVTTGYGERVNSAIYWRIRN